MDFNYLDIGIIVVILLTALVGMVQGFVWMTIFLVTWITAVFLSVTYSADLAKALPFDLSNDLIQTGISALLIFLGVLLAGALINFLFGKAIKAIGIGAIDRIFGTGLGIALGTLILSLLVMLAGMTPLPDQDIWKTSGLVPKLEESASWIKSFVPPEFDEYLQLPAESKPAIVPST
ncbi:MAG TPA: CvpA family protein [Leucothrix mucor]|nr:CvpA family protein [Leucothrix mucor]